MPKLVFANQLRGLAAVFVAGSHLVGAFWAMRDFVGLATASPVQGGVPPRIMSLFDQTWLNFGPFGVGLFFLISGLVIPISLAQHTRGSFLLARALRIYPTYIAALLLEMAVLHAGAAYWGKPFPFSNWQIIGNALLIYNTVGQPSIDMVNWTLCVELKFYFLMMLLAPWIRQGSVSTLLLAGFAMLGTNVAIMRYFTPDAPLGELARQFTIESTAIIFMLTGVLFNFRLRGLMRLPAFLGSVAVVLAVFIAAWTQSAIAGQFPIVTANYFYAFVLFAALFPLRRYARPLWVLDFMASISFPFYLIHSLIGYSLLKVLMLHFKLSYALAVGITVPVLLSLATALHLTIELKSIAAGKFLGRGNKAAAPSLASGPVLPA